MQSELSIGVLGDRLVSGDGGTVILKGVNISGTEWECLGGAVFAGPSDDASIEAIAAWHVNAVRIPLNEDCWLGLNGASIDAGAYRAAILAYVERLHRHGLYAVLDLHWSAPGEALARSGQPMADADHSPAFWSSVATAFKADHAVLFDLYNEPRGVSWSCWREGCDEPGFAVAGMQKLIDTIREAGATQPVMVGGLGAASQLGPAWLANRPTDPAGQLVASVHVYDEGDVGYFNHEIGTVASQFPVVSGEVGETDCAHADLDSYLSWADAHDVSYLAWAWYTGSCAHYPALISDYGGTPTAFGLGYREHLRIAASTSIAVDPPAPEPVISGRGSLAGRGAHRTRRRCPARRSRGARRPKRCSAISAARIVSRPSR